jgi:hypothetical protein
MSEADKTLEDKMLSLNNDFLTHKLVEGYQQERLKEAQIRRLLKESKAAKPGLRERFLTRSGVFLITLGQRLVERNGAKVLPPYLLDQPYHLGKNGKLI